MFLTFKNLGPGQPLKQGSMGTAPREEAAQKLACLIAEKSTSHTELFAGHRAFTAAQHHLFHTCFSCTSAVRDLRFSRAALGLLRSVPQDWPNTVQIQGVEALNPHCTHLHVFLLL